jgi:hypothetical protein
MPIDRLWGEAAALAASAGATRGVLLAGAVAIAVALLGRALRSSTLRASAPAFGMVVGWAAVAAGSGPALRFAPERLAFLPVAALLAGSLAGPAGSRRAWAATALLGCFCVWWLAGSPHGGGGLLADWPALLAVALLAAGLARGITQPAWVAVAEAATLWLALLVAHVAAPWPTIALVPLAAAAALVGRSNQAAAVLTVHAGILGATAAALLGAGGVAAFRPGFADLAALAPVAVAWLTPRLPKPRQAKPPSPPPSVPAKRRRKPRKP